jgi:hypothetical protein
MTSQRVSKRRWTLAGAALVLIGSLGLATFPLLSRLPFMSDALLFPTIVALTLLMAVGAILAIFTMK